jgi:hypothetical protein
MDPPPDLILALQEGRSDAAGSFAARLAHELDLHVVWTAGRGPDRRRSVSGGGSWPSDHCGVTAELEIAT